MTQQSTYHRGSQNYGTGYEMMARIDELEGELGALSKRHEKTLVLGADNRDKLAKAMEALSRIHKWVDCYATHSDQCKRGTRCTCGLTIERMKLHGGPSSLAELTNE